MLSTPNTRPEPPRDTSTSTANQVRGLPRTLTSLPLPAHSLRHARCGGADNLPPNGPLGAQVQLPSTFPCAFPQRLHNALTFSQATMLGRFPSILGYPGSCVQRVYTSDEQMDQIELRRERGMLGERLSAPPQRAWRKL